MLTLILIFSLMPLSVLYVLADYLIYPLVRHVVRYRLKVVQKNIRLSFPEKSLQEQNELVNAFYHHFADILVEIIYGFRISDQEMLERVVFDNVDMLEELAHKKHGVMVYLGHICNWEWLADLNKRFQDKSIIEYNVYRKQKNSVNPIITSVILIMDSVLAVAYLNSLLASGLPYDRPSL